MYSSRSDEWETPGELYGRLHDEFDFQIDLAATPKNAKCRKFFTANDDALAQSWHTTAQRGWLNPPYSRTLLDRYRVTEDDMKDVGREVFGIVYPGDPSTPKRVSSLYRNDEHAVRAPIADGVKHAVLLDTEGL